jgi:hypothetical protein
VVVGWEPASDSFGWVPFLEFDTPSFSRPPFQEGNVIGHARGRDRRASCDLRSGGSFHQKKDPFPKGTGSFFSRHACRRGSVLAVISRSVEGNMLMGGGRSSGKPTDAASSPFPSISVELRYAAILSISSRSQSVTNVQASRSLSK